VDVAGFDPSFDAGVDNISSFDADEEAEVETDPDVYLDAGANIDDGGYANAGGNNSGRTFSSITPAAKKQYTERVRKAIEDLNTEWAKFKYLIRSNAVGPSLDFNPPDPHFSMAFIFMSAGITTAEETLQQGARSRKHGFGLHVVYVDKKSGTKCTIPSKVKECVLACQEQEKDIYFRCQSLEWGPPQRQPNGTFASSPIYDGSILDLDMKNECNAWKTQNNPHKRLLELFEAQGWLVQRLSSGKGPAAAIVPPAQIAAGMLLAKWLSEHVPDSLVSRAFVKWSRDTNGGGEAGGYSVG